MNEFEEPDLTVKSGPAKQMTPLTDDDIHRLTGVYLRWWRFSDVDTRKAFKELLDEVQRLRGPCWEPDQAGSLRRVIAKFKK